MKTLFIQILSNKSIIWFESYKKCHTAAYEWKWYQKSFYHVWETVKNIHAYDI
jgi:hypothetical protein